MTLPDSPWPDLAAAQSFMRQLAGSMAPGPAPLPVASLAAWLTRHELGPAAWFRFRAVWPALGAALRADALAATAENRIHLTALNRALTALEPTGIPVLILKGAALLHLYDAPGLRTMSDVDFWIQPDQSEAAIAALLTAGFGPQFPDRPIQLSQSGKLKLIHPQLAAAGLELHSYPYTGQWLRNAARIDQQSVWERRHYLAVGDGVAWQPDATDLFLHVAVHLAVNHQFDRSTFRNLLDLATLCHKQPPDWPALLARANAWGLRTALWLPLWLLEQLFAPPGVAACLPQLAPAFPRRQLLTRWLAPRRVLTGRQLNNPLARRLLLLSLCDHPSRLPRLLRPATTL